MSTNANPQQQQHQQQQMSGESGPYQQPQQQQQPQRMKPAYPVIYAQQRQQPQAHQVIYAQQPQVVQYPHQQQQQSVNNADDDEFTSAQIASSVAVLACSAINVFLLILALSLDNMTIFKFTPKNNFHARSLEMTCTRSKHIVSPPSDADDWEHKFAEVCDAKEELPLFWKYEDFCDLEKGGDTFYGLNVAAIVMVAVAMVFLLFYVTKASNKICGRSRRHLTCGAIWLWLVAALLLGIGMVAFYTNGVDPACWPSKDDAKSLIRTQYPSVERNDGYLTLVDGEIYNFMGPSGIITVIVGLMLLCMPLCMTCHYFHFAQKRR